MTSKNINCGALDEEIGGVEAIAALDALEAEASGASYQDDEEPHDLLHLFQLAFSPCKMAADSAGDGHWHPYARLLSELGYVKVYDQEALWDLTDAYKADPDGIIGDIMAAIRAGTIWKCLGILGPDDTSKVFDEIYEKYQAGSRYIKLAGRYCEVWKLAANKPVRRAPIYLQA